MIRLVTCVIVSCGSCGEDAEIGDMLVHFDSYTNAVRSLTEHGWRFLAGDQVLCGHCANARDCETYGHHWGAWRTCRCRGQSKHHLQFVTPEALVAGVCAAKVRWCERCAVPAQAAGSVLPAGGDA